MALPGRERTFAFESCKDLLDKLSWEISHLTALADGTIGSIREASYWATNAAITAWSLSDWILADMSDEQVAAIGLSAKRGSKQLIEFQNFLRQNEHINAIAAIALTAKHAELTPSSAARFEGVDAEATQMAPLILTDGTTFPRRWELMVKIGHVRFFAHTALSLARSELQDLIYRHGIAKDF